MSNPKWRKQQGQEQWKVVGGKSFIKSNPCSLEAGYSAYYQKNGSFYTGGSFDSLQDAKQAVEAKLK